MSWNGEDLFKSVLLGGGGAGGSGGGSSVQPDWNQNDPAAADYVKNRTHYGSEVNIVWDETYANATGCQSKNWNTGATTRSGVKKVSAQTLSVEEVLQSGHIDASKPFDVTENLLINVTEDGYAILAPATKTGQPQYPAVVVAFSAGYEVYDMYTNGKASNSYWSVIPEPGIYFRQSTYGSAESLVYGFSCNNLKTLDEKYIPDTIARKSELEGLGGSDGAFVVNLTPQTEGQYDLYTADKTFEETLAACKAGREVFFRFEEITEEYETRESAKVNSYLYDTSSDTPYGVIDAGCIRFDGEGAVMVMYKYETDGVVSRIEFKYTA